LKIEQFKCQPFSISFKTSLKSSKGQYDHREGFWLEIMSEDYVGYGEASPLLGFSMESLHEVYYVFKGFFHAVKNEDVDEEELLLLAEVHCSDCPSARFAVETAIYDILSQQANISMSQYLNKSSLSSIEVNGMFGMHTALDGFKVLKVKVGVSNIFDEIELLEGLTESFGSEVLFRLDANEVFDLPKAIRFCKEMKKFNIDYIEQPLPIHDLEDLEELQCHTEIPIALDESITTFESVKTIIDKELAQVFVIKPMVSGGFVESSKIIEIARSNDIKSIISSSLETSIGRMACIHLAASNEIKDPCGLATDQFFSEKMSTPKIENGILNLSKLSGLGLKLEF